MKRRFTREQRLTMIYGILCIVLIIVMLQLWLLMATMNAYLGGDQSVIWPAALASLICFGLNSGLLWYVFRMERQR
jgi:multidrug resistance efflux pump